MYPSRGNAGNAKSKIRSDCRHLQNRSPISTGRSESEGAGGGASSAQLEILQTRVLPGSLLKGGYRLTADASNAGQHPQDPITQVPREVETKVQRARDDVRFMTNEAGSPEEGVIDVCAFTPHKRPH
jgi:hypothetical protein